eukprot:TRINITY_DN54501_c0_g1_i1.p1 TRINITY_DN54501_c0_g1~~TRINITY_DN54501_c0_g1_i1.p1  ORF type:complete len:289 (-),score=6.57 TRINITY_DN54501_c0_g1_i1:147-1013(-)
MTENVTIDQHRQSGTESVLALEQEGRDDASTTAATLHRNGFASVSIRFVRLYIQRFDAALFRMVSTHFGGRRRLPDHALILVHQIRPWGIIGVLTIAAAMLGWLLFIVYGWCIYLMGTPQECEYLHRWLFLILIATTLGMAPCLSLLMFPLIMWGLLEGKHMQIHLPSSAHQKCPELWSFADMALSAVFLICAWILILLFLIIRFDRWHKSVQQSGEVFRRWILQAPSIPAGEGLECPICLSDSFHATTWKKLPCGHVFHESCLLRWAQTSRGISCALCRADYVRDAV